MIGDSHPLFTELTTNGSYCWVKVWTIFNLIITHRVGNGKIWKFGNASRQPSHVILQVTLHIISYKSHSNIKITCVLMS